MMHNRSTPIRALILVKHAMPAIDPDIPSPQWQLSDAGRARCIPLADHLAAYHPVFAAASAEPKATETARIVVDRLDLPLEVIAALHENDRSGLGWLGAEELEATIARFFAQPDQRVMGDETADEAHARFAAAVSDVLRRRPDETVVVVAHGTVITLFVARLAGLEPFPFWKRLGLPSFVVLSLPNLTLETVVASMIDDQA